MVQVLADDETIGLHLTRSTLSNVHIHASRVDFLLALRKPLSAWQRWPVPDPVESVRLPRGSRSRDLDVLLTPQVSAHCRVACVRKLLLSLLRDCATVDLVALTVIVVLCRQQNTSTVAAVTSSIPHSMNVEELVVCFRLCRSVYIYCTTVCRLAGLTLRQGDMTVLLVSQSHVGTWCCLEPWAPIGLRHGRLRLSTHWITVQDRVDLATIRWDKVDHLRVEITS